MRTFLYIVWALIPAFFFMMALWSWLEKVSNRQKKENPQDFFSQGLFVLGCVLVAVLLDRYALEALVHGPLQDAVPLGFLQVILLPIILYAGGLIFGGSKAIVISKAPRVSNRPGRTRRRSY